MKTRALYLAVASTLVVLAGCKDDDLTTNPTPWHEGDDITFNVRAGFENEESTRPSRTLYTDDEYTVGDKTYERVEWVIGDQVRIYCEQANNPLNSSHWSDYQVTARTNDGENKEDYATLDRLNDEGASLQWGSADQDHTFYAVYPSPKQNTYAGIEKNIVSGEIPAAQAPKSIEMETEDGKPLYDCKPNMDYAYMVAKTTVAAGADRNVNLSFQSIATALELELIGPNLPNTSSAEIITDVVISSDSENINGAFTCDLDQTGSDGYPLCDTAESADARNQINVSLIKDGAGIEMREGYKIKLTVFLLPVKDLSGLKITLVSTKGRKTHSLVALVDGSYNDITLKAHLKHLVQNIQIPDQMDASRWISQLNDNILLSQLSIPGTGNSYSYQTTKTPSKYYQAQTLSIEEQWNLGIRCFEFTTSLAKEQNVTNMGNCRLVSNSNANDNYTETVGDVVTSIHGMLEKHKNEFAIIILSYQPQGTRDGRTFLEEFTTYFDQLSYGTALLSPDLTVDKARGKLMFIIRPTSDGEDVLSHSDLNNVANKDFVVVDGWGSLFDKWKQRGYPVTTNLGHESGTGVITMEASMTKAVDYGSSEPSFSLLTKGDPDYTYVSNKSYNLWVQEWARVVERDFSKKLGTYSQNRKSYDFWVKWGESYNEKLADAKLTFTKSIEDKENKTMFYINSLCGFFIDETKEDTYRPLVTLPNGTEDWGSSYGDIETFSNRINGDFYTYVLDQGSTTGPMGIVLMNRVGNEAVPGSMYMPNVIVSNNFKFPLLTSESTGGTTSKTNGNTYQQGGNAIR